MGADINFYVEKLQDGQWISASRLDLDEEGTPDLESWYTDRSLEVWAAIEPAQADLYGIDPVPPVRGARPASITEASEHVQYVFDANDPGRDPVIVTLADLLAYDWDSVPDTKNLRRTLNRMEKLDLPADHVRAVIWFA